MERLLALATARPCPRFPSHALFFSKLARCVASFCEVHREGMETRPRSELAAAIAAADGQPHTSAYSLLAR